VQIERVTDRPGDLVPLLKLDDALFRGDPAYIPRSMDARLDPYRPTHPFYRHGAAAHFAARSGRKVLGRMSGFVDGRLDGRIGWFGLAASRDDPEVTHGLLDAVAEFARSRGVRSMRGPVDLTIWHACRIQTGGPRTPRYFIEPQYPPHLGDHLTGWGLQPARRFVLLDHPSFEVDEAQADALLQRPRAAGYRVRPLDLQHMDQEMARMRTVANRCFAQSMGFVALSRREFHALYRDLSRRVDPAMVQIAEAPDGSPAGFALSLPDFSEALRALGRGGALAKLRALRAKMRIGTLFFKTLAVMPDHRGAGLAPALAVSAHRAGAQRGLTRTVQGFFDEDNAPSIRASEAGLRLASPQTRHYAILGAEL
jgi:GNAT superfamily N-acetyltransferase